MSIKKALVFGVLVCLGTTPLRAAIPAAETQALKALYDATGGGNWNNKTGWLGAPGTECSWVGVTCSNGNANVVGINLSGNNLVGTLPAELQNLTKLTTLYLGQNSLGTLPASLGNVVSLQTLNLDNAGLTGAIPSQLGNLLNLKALELRWNSGLSGPIPASLGSLAAAERIVIPGCSLTGTIPPALGGLSKLLELDLNNNKLSGSIPVELSRLSSLQNLYLNGNQLSAGIPKELGSLPSLQELFLDGNPLGGAIPAELGSLKKATKIHLQYAGLTGTIPAALGALAACVELDLSNNLLTGPIPKELGNLPAIQNLYLNNNQLSGPIPGELGAARTLVLLSLYSNVLTGSIPTGLGSLSKLETLYLGNNQLEGGVPQELAGLTSLVKLYVLNNKLTSINAATLAKLTKLQELGVSSNPLAQPVVLDPLAALTSLKILDISTCGLTGAIPSFVGSLGSLEELYLGNNAFSGTIPDLSGLAHLRRLGLNDNSLTGPLPANLGRIPTLVAISAQNNHLSGSLPVELSVLSHLDYLDAHGNGLTGSIPREFGSLVSLQELHLEGNQLSGAIPPELGNLQVLFSVSLQDNQLTGTFPSALGQLANLRYLDLSRNQIGGALPPEIGNLALLEGLSLSGNQIRSLPYEIGKLTRLGYLILDGNLIAGSIPRELGNLTELVQLNLQANQLSGPIPSELGALKKLTRLTMSFNQLTGEIPAALGGLSALEDFYLESNQLSGSIPAALGSLPSIRGINFTKNALTGPIPAEIGSLSTLGGLWIGGNKLSGALPSTLTKLTNIYDGWGLDLRHNALYTDDAAVREWVNNNSYGFDQTQTIAPPGVTAPIASTASVTLRWNPILYQDNAGGYEVLVSQSTSSTPFVGARTATKSDSSATVANLQPGTTYTFSVRTVTLPSENNPNTVTSELSPGVIKSTTPAGSVTVTLSPATVRMVNGTTANMTATVAPASATPVVVTLSSSNTSVATVPGSVTIPANASTATFAVTGRNYGTTAITAALPTSTGGGSAAADVTVAGSACVAPNAPSFLSSTGGNLAVRAGNSITLTWTASLAADPGGSYQVDVYPNSDCQTGLKQVRVSKPTLTVPTSSSQAGAFCFVVRAISSQNCPSGDSSRLTVTVQPGPAAFVVEQSAPLSVATSLNTPPPPSKVVFKNIGFTATALAIRSTLAFASASPVSFPSVAPGGTAEVTLTYDPLSTTGKAMLQGSVCGFWNDGSDRTVCAAATLTVFERPIVPGEAAKPQISGSSDIHFIAPPGVTPPTQVITVRNPSPSAIRIAPGISPGGTWLSVAGDVLTPIAAGASRDLTLTVDRSKRATADGAPPLSTQLFLTNVDGPPGDRTLVTVFDEEPPATTQGTNRPFLGANEYSLILGSSVYAPGGGGAIFVSDGWIRNKAPGVVTADIYYTPSDTNGIGNPQVRRATITLQPYGTYRLSDFVRGLFDTSGSGSVEIRSSAIADLSVRTTVDALTVKNGSTVRYGAEIPTIQSREGVGVTRLGGASLFLPGLRGGAGSVSRTNIILTETSGSQATVALRLLQIDGSLLREGQVTLAPYSKTQVNGGNPLLFPEGVSIDGASLEVKPVSGAGSVAAFATVVDNTSQGYTTRTGRFAPQALLGSPPLQVSPANQGSTRKSAGTRSPLSTLTRLAIPAAVHAGAKTNSFYTTTVSITNGVFSDASLVLKYVVNGQVVATQPVTVPGRATKNYPDVVANLFGITDDSVGMIFVEGDAAKVVVTSDTSTLLDPTQPAGGLSPSTLSAYAPESTYALGDPQTGPPSPVISHPALEESARFRTNLILAEVQGSPATVRVRLFPPGSGGVPLAEKTYTLKAFERVQENNFMVKMAGPGEYLDHETTIEWLSGSGRVLGVATKVDNNPESKRADVYVLGPTGGLQGLIGF